VEKRTAAGGGPADRQAYLTAFHADELATHVLLRQLALRGEPAAGFGLVAEVTQIDAAHAILGTAYTGALALADPTHWDAQRLDRAMRGLDRSINGRLDALAERLAAQISRILDESEAAERARFETLTRVLWVTMILSILLMAALLWRAMADRTARA